MRKLIKTFDYGTVPNSYDLFKAIALALMIVDHTGYYLFPDNIWLRVLGRIAFPIFLFLVGYSQSYRFDKWLLVGAVLVFISQGINGVPMLPLNILFSILLWRMLLGWLEKRQHILNDILMVWVAMVIFYLPTIFLIEYGTLGLMFALLGWYVRQRQMDAGMRLTWLFSTFFWIISQAFAFQFTAPQVMLFIIEGICLAMALSQFTLRSHLLPPEHTTLSPTWLEKLVILTARNSLLIYVLHVILFQCLAHALYPETYGQLFIFYR